MAIDPAQIELTPAQKRRLAQLAEQKGKDYSALVDELLLSTVSSDPSSDLSPDQNGSANAAEEVATVENDFTDEPSLYNELARRGMLGCFDGPTDLATNPKHMEGFGRDHGENPR